MEKVAGLLVCQHKKKLLNRLQCSFSEENGKWDKLEPILPVQIQELKSGPPNIPLETCRLTVKHLNDLE